MFNRLRKERKALVVKEKIMQSATSPMRGPWTPMSLLAHDGPDLPAETIDLAAPSFVGGIAI
jgi:hypothetical protein